ncbi:14057_t:CDS:1 [Acaulospora colombiana]|uniref:14057_t:CDS:1 n=1 Tax=Acaulospora colombiana TaxID=27376 RepID=A0ACA9LPW8_9GLOM|nr:14057_t:CDS:1 [Acaulospora colombiana]
MLMRYPAIDDVEVLVPQAIYLRDHLSQEGGEQIIQQNAVRLGKPIILQSLPVKRDAVRIEGLVQGGIVSVTKNVLESRGAAMINKAILSAVGANFRKRQNSPDFSSRYQHVSHDPLYTDVPYQPSKINYLDQSNQTRHNFEEITRLREQNRQMGIVVQKVIDILESKFREDNDKIEKSSEGSASRSSFEYIAGNSNEESSDTLPSSDPLHVLKGLKHIVDVLNGSGELNPHILDSPPSNVHEDHEHWEVVDDEVSVVSIAGTEDEAAPSVTKEVRTKQEKNVPSIPKPSITGSAIAKPISVPRLNSTSLPPIPTSSPPLPPLPRSSSPKSPPSSDNDVTNSTGVFHSESESPANERSSSSSTTKMSKALPPTPKVARPTSTKPKFKLEDILDAAENDDSETSKSSISSNSKYSWMVEGFTDDDDNSLFNPKRASVNSINSLTGYASGLGYADGEDHVRKIIPTTSAATQRRSQSSISFAAPSNLIDPLSESPFEDSVEEKGIDERSIESILSTSRSTKKVSSHHPITPAVPVEDPLGVL